MTNEQIETLIQHTRRIADALEGVNYDLDHILDHVEGIEATLDHQAGIIRQEQR